MLVIMGVVAAFVAAVVVTAARVRSVFIMFGHA
jgi:hypothetical protein